MRVFDKVLNDSNREEWIKIFFDYFHSGKPVHPLVAVQSYKLEAENSTKVFVRRIEGNYFVSNKNGRLLAEFEDQFNLVTEFNCCGVASGRKGIDSKTYKHWYLINTRGETLCLDYYNIYIEDHARTIRQYQRVVGRGEIY